MNAQTVASANWEEGKSMVQTADGGFVIAGSWRQTELAVYQISSIDVCGNEVFTFSDIHKPIVLKYEFLSADLLEFQFNYYEGVGGLTYKMFMGYSKDQINMLAGDLNMNVFSMANIFGNENLVYFQVRASYCHCGGNSVGGELFQPVSNILKIGNPNSPTIQTGIGEIDDLQFTLSPNPMKEITILQLQTLVGNNMFINIYDVSGKLVREIQNPESSSKIVIEKNDLNAGMYFVELEKENSSTQVKKLIIE